MWFKERNVLSCWRNISSDDEAMVIDGRSFHALATATGTAQSTSAVRQVGGTTSDNNVLFMQHTHTHLMALCPGLPGWAGTRKVKPIWILLQQETVSGSGISRAICKSALRSTQITMPAADHLVFTGWMPFMTPNQQLQSTEGKVGTKYKKIKGWSWHHSSVLSASVCLAMNV